MRYGTSTRTNTGEKVWLTWDCEYCQTNGIHGSKRECPNCGMPRGRKIRYNIDDIAGELTEEEAKNHGKPDWQCSFCDTYNKWSNESCESCGAERSEKTYHDVGREIEQEQASRQEQANVDNTEHSSWYENEVARRNKQLARKRKRGVLIAVIAMLTAVFTGVCAFNLLPSKVVTDVVDKSWEQSIAIEEKEVVTDSGWTKPAGARELDREWKVKEYNKKILDHYKTEYKDVQKSRQVYVGDEVTYEYVDNGDGTADKIKVTTPKYDTEYYTEKEEVRVPVYRYEDEYAYYYTYEYDKWSVVRSVDTAGTTEEPYYGEPNLDADEREGKKSGEYRIVVDIDGEKTTYDLSIDDWRLIEVGDSVTISVPKIGTYVKLLEVNGDKVE